MKNTIILLALFSVLAACSTTQTDPAPPIEGKLSLIVNVHNLKCCEGSLLLALYDSEKRWLDKYGMARGRINFVTGESQTIEINGIPAGNYGVVVFQDLNLNRDLDRFLWIFPKEPYGFSNSDGSFRPPSFDDAKVSVTEDTEIDIRLVR